MCSEESEAGDVETTKGETRVPVCDEVEGDEENLEK